MPKRVAVFHVCYFTKCSYLKNILIKRRNVITFFGVRVTVLQGCRCVRGNSGMTVKSRVVSWEYSALQGTGPEKCVLMGYYTVSLGNKIPTFQANLVLPS